MCHPAQFLARDPLKKYLIYLFFYRILRVVKTTNNKIKGVIMFSRFMKELDQFQINYAICGQQLFRDWLVEKIGLGSSIAKSSIEPSYENNNVVYFNFKSIGLDDLYKLLEFFNIPRENYKTNQPLPITEKKLFDELLPQFKNEITETAITTPKKLRKYQVSSQAELALHAIHGISESTRVLLKTINEMIKNGETVEQSFIDMLYLIDGFLHSNTESSYSLYLPHIHERFIQTPVENKLHERFSSIILEMQNAFTAYEKFNRVEIVKAVKKLFTDLEDFVNQYGISISQCDIFEETLYKMAGIERLPKKSKFETSWNDRTRLEFTITDLAEEDAEKLLQFFHAEGDDSATRSLLSDSSHDYSIPKSISSNEMAEMPQRYAVPNPVKTKTDQFQVDGEVIINKIFPEFKKQIQQLVEASPAALQSYQEKSKEYMQSHCKPVSTVSSSPSVVKEEPKVASIEKNEKAEAKEEKVVTEKAEAAVSDQTVEQQKPVEIHHSKAYKFKHAISSFFANHSGQKKANEIVSKTTLKP